MIGVGWVFIHVTIKLGASKVIYYLFLIQGIPYNSNSAIFRTDSMTDTFVFFSLIIDSSSCKTFI
jgi:hypothetical protein